MGGGSLMKFALAVTAIVITGAFGAPAHADVIIPGYFGGIVDDGTYTDSGPVNTPFVAGQPITGSFTFDATTDMFTSFQIGGYTAQPGYTSIYSPALSQTAYAYLGVQNPVANAAPSNSLQINFYYENLPGQSTANIANFILHPDGYSQDLLGGSPSFFAAYITNGDGSVTQVDGLLTSYAAPEPASLMLALSGLTGLGFVRRRKRSA